MVAIHEDNNTRSAPVLRVAGSNITTPPLRWPEIPFVVAVTACALVAVVSVVTTTLFLLSVRRMRRVQPGKTDADKTTMPKPASAVSITETDAEYEDIYSRIDDIVPSSRLARDDNSFPRFAVEACQGQGCQYVTGGKVENVMMSDIEPLYATVDEVLKTISQEIAVQNDGGLVMASPGVRSLDISQNCRVQDCINGTKDALAKALLYTKIDITKTIRYRLKMAQILNMSNRNKNTNGKDDDVTNIDFVDNVLYESMTSQKDNKTTENDKQNESYEQPNIVNHKMEGCCNIRCENESGEFERLSTRIITNITADGNNNKNGKHMMPDASLYETIPANFDSTETDYSLKEEVKTREITNDTTENKIDANITMAEVGSDENIYMCINENHYSMETTLDTERTDIYEEGRGFPSRETSL